LVSVSSWAAARGSKFLAAKRQCWVSCPDNGDPLESGHLFLFKLKGSINKIAGGGIFIGYSKLQLSVAWNIFREHNGAASLQEFSESIRAYMSAGNAHAPDPHIGCIILTQPFFWPESLWMPPPADWSRNIVRGKTYSTDTESGRRLYGDVLERLQSPAVTELALNEERYGKPTLIQPRLGQGGFRYAVTERYGRRCAMTGERSLPALEAAHIRPYSEQVHTACQTGCCCVRTCTGCLMPGTSPSHPIFA